MDNPIRIRAEDGSVVDLAERRARITRAMEQDDNVAVRRYYLDSIAVIDALVAALSVPLQTMSQQSITATSRMQGRNDALKTVRQAAGVVEE